VEFQAASPSPVQSWFGLATPSVGVLMVIFRDSLPSTIFSTATSHDKIFSSMVIVCFSPMITILPLATSPCSGGINTLEFYKSMVLTEKDSYPPASP
jgi:hypothetical protein